MRVGDYAKALCYSLTVEAGLRMLPLDRLAKHLGVATKLSGPRDSPPRASLSRAARAADAVLALWPANGRCLRRTLVLGAILRRHSPVLRIGVRRNADQLSAHAWLEIGGVPVAERIGPEFHALA